MPLCEKNRKGCFMPDFKKDPALMKKINAICLQFRVCSTCPLNVYVSATSKGFKCAANSESNDYVWMVIKKYEEKKR